MTNKKIVVAVHSLDDAFKNSLTNKAANIFYIMEDDLEAWVDNPSIFDAKFFGDRAIDMYLNFIYKKGDKGFEQDSLESKIVDFRKRNFLFNK